MPVDELDPPRASDPQPKNSGGGIRVPRSVLVALRTIEVLAVTQPIGVGALARELDLPKSTVQRTLYALEAAGYAYRAGANSLWSLTLKVFQIGSRAVQGFDVREAALPFLEALRDTTGESAYLSLRDGDQTFILERADSPQPVRAYVEVGTTFPMNCTAAGKAFLAAESDERLAELLAGELPALTDRSKTTAKALEEDLQQARREGYAVNRGESRIEVVSVGSAVIDSSGDAVAAVVVAAPRSRVSEERITELGQATRDTAQQVSRLLGAAENA